MKQFKCSMQKKMESLSKKSEATTEDISVKLTELKDVTDADKVLDDLKKLGFYTIEYGDYASKDTSYAVLKHPNGMYAELDYTWVQDSSGRDSYSPGEVVAYDYFKDKDEYEEIHGYSPNESKKPEACNGGKKDDKKDGKAAESKKSEGVIGIGGTMYASKLKSLARKLGSFGFKVSDNVEVKDENANDKSAEYNLSAEKDGKSYKINVDIYEGKHTTITLRDGATNAYISHLGEGSSFASAVSVIDADSVKSESKKSEGIGDHIKMNIDYNTFMRLLDAAAYLDADDDYKDALWEYFSEFGELDGDACEFFDNLFQYTDWYTAEDVWDNYDNILGTKPEDKDAEEALDAYLEEHGDDLGGASVYKHGDHYLILQ